MRDIRCGFFGVSSLILLLSFIAHFAHGAPVSPLGSPESEDDLDSPSMDPSYDSASTFPDPDFSSPDGLVFDTNHNLPNPLFNSESPCYSDSPCRLSSSDIAIRSPGDITIHRRGKAKDKAKKGAKKAVSNSKYNTKAPGGGMAVAGEVVGKVGSAISKAGNALPGPIGIALKVIGTFLSILGKIFGGLAAKERKSAQERGDFTQKVVEQTAQKHPGWMVVTLYTRWKPQTYFPGKKGRDWSVGSTETHTGMGEFHYRVFAARSGLFYFDGQRGYENWAWQAPANKLHAVPADASDVEKRIVVVDGDYPPGIPPVAGQCHLHVDVFEMKKGPRRIVAGLQDNVRNAIGADSGPLPLTLHSQLTDVIVLNEPSREKGKKGKKGKRKAGHHLDITLGGKSLECDVGGIDHGQTQMDCQFACSGFKK
ncbi:hypothetical protein BDP27DRAFT_1403093 [Rhodocollybia butyracea]|uniref:Uncharacterized protein n=1 Tax=Rhodocollybia butyracea TaxID=206335 RepID=A0A9P5U6C7_9AGAR|nr:hypothetical protein BDP27DRAFT_1403093 [Rhodocollybia butyracea]